MSVNFSLIIKDMFLEHFTTMQTSYDQIFTAEEVLPINCSYHTVILFVTSPHSGHVVYNVQSSL